MKATTPLPVYVSAEIRAEMGRQLKTVADLARELGITHKRARELYAGVREYPLSDMERIAVWLAVPLAQFTDPSYHVAKMRPRTSATEGRRSA